MRPVACLPLNRLSFWLATISLGYRAEVLHGSKTVKNSLDHPVLWNLRHHDDAGPWRRGGGRGVVGEGDGP